MSHPDDRAAEHQIREALATFVPLLESPDATARVRCYTPDAIFVQPGSDPVRGHEEMLLRNVTALCDVNLEPEHIEVSGDLAYAYGRFSCDVDTSDGRKMALPAHFLMVLRKGVDGAWLIAREFITPIREDRNDLTCLKHGLETMART
jgi:ketosteroid isomerase-like protein